MFKFNWEIFGLAIILFLASYLRLGNSGIIEYKADEANLSHMALDLANGRSLPFLGISSSVGVPNAPFNVYVLAIPYLFGNNPILATQFIGLMNVVAIGLVYLFTRRYSNVGIALAVALFFAFNPWALLFSRKIWAQNMLPLFVVATVGTGVWGFIEDKRWARIAHLPLLIITGQIHYGAFVIIPVTLYLLWYKRKQWSRAFWGGLVIALLLTLPYSFGIIREVINNGTGILQSNTLNNDSSSVGLSDDALHGISILVTGEEIHSLAGNEEYRNYLDTVPDAYPLFRILAWAILLSTIWLLIRVFRQKDARTAVDIVLLIWFISPIAFFSITWTPFYIHYLIPSLPAAFIILGFAACDLWGWLTQRNRQTAKLVFSSAIIVATIILFLQTWLWLSLLDFVDTHYTPGGFGTPLHHLLDIRTAIRNQDSDYVLIANIDEEMDVVWRTLLYDDVVRFENSVTTVYPEQETIYLSNRCGDEAQQFELRAGEGCYAISTRSKVDFDDGGYTPSEQSILFANGVRIIAYRWEETPQARLELVWQIESKAAENYMFAVHLFNAQGGRIDVLDGLSWEAQYWQPGDTVVRNFYPSAQTVENTSSVHLGMYTHDGITFHGVDLLDENGTPIGQSIELSIEQPNHQ